MGASASSTALRPFQLCVPTRREVWDLEASHETDKIETEHGSFNGYLLVRELGVGSTGSVALVRQRHRSKPLYALRTIRRGRVTATFLDEFKQDIGIVRDFDHRGITKLFDVQFCPAKIQMLTESCAGGNLYKRKPYTELQAASIVRQILSAVSYMHSEGYVHRNIKFENVMFESMTSFHVKLVDFGHSCGYNPTRPLEGQSKYIQTMSPELIAGERTWQCDLWSVGVVAFELLAGEKPFSADKVSNLMFQITNAKYHFDSKWHSKTNDAIFFCRALLEKDMFKRPTAGEALKHSWFKRATKVDQQIKTATSVNAIDREILIHSQDSPALQKLVTILVYRHSFPREVRILRQRFDHFDVEGSGSISYEEFCQAFEAISTDDDVSKLLHGLDASSGHNCRIAHKLFLADALTVWGYVSEECLMTSFDRLQGNFETEQETLETNNPMPIVGEQEHGTDHEGMTTLSERLLLVRKELDELTKEVLHQRPSLRVTM